MRDLILNKFVLITFCIIVLILFLCMVVLIIDSEKKQTKYYNYKIKYDYDFAKYDSMLKKQKRILFKKRIQLVILKMLVKIKGV